MKMETLRPDVTKEEQGSETGQKLRLLLDKLHGEEHDDYGKLIQFLTERCQVTILKKRPLDLKLLTENDVFLLISPSKSWEESEVETVRRYVESHGGILVAMTLDGRKPERLNKLLEPFGLSVIRGTVGEKYLDRESLEDSQLLDGVASLASGTVWLYESTKIAASNQAEVVLQYKDATLGAKRPLGKGTAYLFSCLPAFGNKQLDQADNRRFLDNLLKSLATPAMKETLEAIAKDEALAAQAIAKDEALAAQATARDEALATQEIVGFILTGRSWDLFFTSDRMIVAKKSSKPMFAGWALAGPLAGYITDSIYKGVKGKKLSELSPDKILRDNKRNFAIRYDEITKFEIRKSFPIGSKEITISTSTDKYVYNWDLGVGRDLKKHTSFLVPLLSDKLSIRD